LPEVEPNSVESEASIAARAIAVLPRIHCSPGGNSTYSISGPSARRTSIAAPTVSGAASSPGSTTTFLLATLRLRPRMNQPP
jgi:hypothetical protein